MSKVIDNIEDINAIDTKAPLDSPVFTGNVGIGTSSPTMRLSVQNTRSNTAGTGFLAYTDSSTAGKRGLRTNTNNAWCFDYYNGSAWSEQMQLDSSGNLLVGTTSTVGSAKQTISTYGNSGVGLTIQNDGATTTGAVFAKFYWNAGQLGSIVGNGSTVAYNTSSDYRLKENIQPMHNALNVVQQLNPVTYTWKVDGSEGQGFIAHELQAIVPECVTGEKDAVDAEGKPVYQGIDTSFLVATLTKAIQELKAEVDDLKAQLEAK